VLRLLLLGAACHQIAHIVTQSLLFKPLREGLRERWRYLGDLVSCHLCFSTWVGLGLALLFRPRFVQPPRLLPARNLDSVLRTVATTAVDAFAIGVVARGFNEVLALLKREVEIREEEVEELRAEPAPAPTPVAEVVAGRR
jgi:hypothetical protein